MVCLTKTYEPLVRKTIVTNIRPFFVGESIPPTYRPTNLEGIEIENPIPQGGVLCDENGEIKALHSCFVENAPKKPQEFYMGVDANILFPILKGLQEQNLPTMYSLEAELTYIQLAQARVLGLSAEWIEKLEKANTRRNCVMIRRLASATPAFEQLKSGDVVLTVNGLLCKSFTDITDQYMSQFLDLV
jgi:pro-apoptotic serine protease NMA111